MVVITGDTHRNFGRVGALCDKLDTTANDTLIILGDAGINYYGDKKDWAFKRELSKLPITLFCLHGNHEQRPETLGYAEIEWNSGMVYTEPEFPNLLFAKDSEVYEFDGKRCIAIGGAYSVDKPYRIANGLGWWADEQPSEETKKRVEQQLEVENWTVDIVLSHTCPLKYEPTEMFIGGIEQSGVDKSTEQWLDGIEDRLHYKRWYCGHYHVDKTIDRLRCLFQNFLEFK